MDLKKWLEGQIRLSVLLIFNITIPCDQGEKLILKTLGLY